jgi:hypothetical protein
MGQIRARHLKRLRLLQSASGHFVGTATAGHLLHERRQKPALVAGFPPTGHLVASPTISLRSLLGNGRSPMSHLARLIHEIHQRSLWQARTIQEGTATLASPVPGSACPPYSESHP